MGKQAKKTTAEIKEEYRSKYDARKVYGWTGYADEPKEKPLVDLIEKIAKEQNLIPSYFYTIAIGEGLGATYVNNNAFYDDISTPTEPNKQLLKTDLEINGFDVIGVDDFGSEFSRYKKHLPSTYNMSTDKNFKFSPGSEFYQKNEINELGKTTKSAVFINLESTLWAFGATVAHRKELFINYGKELAYGTPTEDEIAYWIYVYFQGEGNAKRWLKSNGSYDITNEKTVRGLVNTLATERLATWRYIKSRNLFSS